MEDPEEVSPLALLRAALADPSFSLKLIIYLVRQGDYLAARALAAGDETAFWPLLFLSLMGTRPLPVPDTATPPPWAAQLAGSPLDPDLES